MKKILLSFALIAIVALSATAQTTVDYPNGAASVITPSVTSKAVAQPLVVSNMLTIYNVGTIDTNKTLTITAATVGMYSKAYILKAGAMVIVKVTCDATARTITSSTGLTNSVVTLTASKSHTITYVYDGSSFVAIGTQKTLQ